MVRQLVILIALFMMVLGVMAQDDNDTPPAGYLDSCHATPIMFDLFGPNCLNPVTWNLQGFYEIDTWIFFVTEEGETDAGVIKGYTWDYAHARYDYWVMTQMPFGNFGGAYDGVPPENIIDAQGDNS